MAGRSSNLYSGVTRWSIPCPPRHRRTSRRTAHTRTCAESSNRAPPGSHRRARASSLSCSSSQAARAVRSRDALLGRAATRCVGLGCVGHAPVSRWGSRVAWTGTSGRTHGPPDRGRGRSRRTHYQNTEASPRGSRLPTGKRPRSLCSRLDGKPLSLAPRRLTGKRPRLFCPAAMETPALAPSRGNGKRPRSLRLPTRMEKRVTRSLPGSWKTSATVPARGDGKRPRSLSFPTRMAKRVHSLPCRSPENVRACSCPPGDGKAVRIRPSLGLMEVACRRPKLQPRPQHPGGRHGLPLVRVVRARKSGEVRPTLDTEESTGVHRGEQPTRGWTSDGSDAKSRRRGGFVSRARPPARSRANMHQRTGKRHAR